MNMNIKRKLIGALILVLVLCGIAFALTDKEYRSMIRGSSEFAHADSELNKIWDILKDDLTGREFEKEKRLQSQWIKSGRDKYAKELLKTGEYSREEAYAAATWARVNELRDKYDRGYDDEYED